MMFEPGEDFMDANYVAQKKLVMFGFAALRNELTLWCVSPLIHVSYLKEWAGQ